MWCMKWNEVLQILINYHKLLQSFNDAIWELMFRFMKKVSVLLTNQNIFFNIKSFKKEDGIQF